jgi:hypothetical protein
MILEMNVYIVHGLKAAWKTFSLFSDIIPYKNVYDSLGKHDFPWLTILSYSTTKIRSDSEAVKSILTDLNFDFMYDDSLTSAQNLSLIQEFLPMFISYFRFLLGTEVIRT